MKMIKKLWGALIAVTVLAVGGLFVPIYTAKAEGTVDVTENVTASSWIEQSELNVTYLSLGENVIPAIGYGIIDNATYTYAQDYIAINGKTIKEINTDETLGASEWTYTIFPSSADVKYQLPVIVYVNNGQLEIKIHDNYAESLGDCVEITAKAGLYFENEGTRYEVTADKTCTVFGQKKTEVDITDGVSIEGWDATGNGMELTYTRIRFPEGVLGDIDFRVMDSEEWTYLQEYISINGRTIADINTNTDTTDYVFATFPSTADVKYEVPVIVYENEDALEVKFHNTYLETLEGDLTITLEAGFYLVQGENKYVVSEDVSLVIEAMTETDITADVSIEGWNATGNGMELTYTIIRFPAGVLPETLNYQVIDTETWAYMQDYIAINGRTIADINTNTDTTDYVFATFPSTADVKYELPVIVYENGDKLEVKFHNSYLETLDGDITITLKAGLSIVNGNATYLVSEDVSFVIEAVEEMDITAGVSIDGWNAAGDGRELTYTLVNFPDGVLPSTLDYHVIDTAAWAFIQEYIEINGKTVKEINEETDVSEYTFLTFPSTVAEKYQLPVIIYENGNMLEVKIHNAYLKTIEGDVEITVKSGLTIQNGNTIYKVTEDVAFTALQITESDISEGITMESWAKTGNAVELTYTRIQFPAGVLPETLDYHMIDDAVWVYIQEYIYFNGKSIKQINEETDVSGYTFSTFPSTEAAKYQLPIILFENGNSLELKFHNAYLETATGDLEITIKAGLSILNGANKYIVSKDICFQLAGDIWGDKNRTYTVTYYVNGEVYGEVETYLYKSTLVFRENVQADAGYTFSGWKYTGPTTIVQDIAIHGYIRAIAYKVTYHLNGGLNNASNPLVYYVTDGEILLKDATKEGATFKGWYTSEDYTQKVEKLSPDQLGDVELYALFEGGDTASSGGCFSMMPMSCGLFVLAGAAMLLKKKRK